MTGALNAAADTLMIDLEMHQTANGGLTVLGSDKRKTVFGMETKVEVLQSFVDNSRCIIVLVVKLVGNVCACLISDGQEGQLTLFIIDGAKLKAANVRILPTYWLRKILYERIVAGVKSTHMKEFYSESWRLHEKGNQWMYDYIKAKNSKIAAAGQDTGL
jgi:hypothetical protein